MVGHQIEQPSDRTLTKNSSGYTTESGTLNSLLRTFHDICKKDDLAVIAVEKLKVFSFHAENYGTALKPVLQYDPTQKCVVGLANGNISKEFIEEHRDKSGDLTTYQRKYCH